METVVPETTVEAAAAPEAETGVEPVEPVESAQPAIETETGEETGGGAE